MKKAGKFVSYLLVMALVTSLLSGLGIKAEKANAKITAGKFTVLEIVPHKTMGTFGYLVDGYFGRSLNQAENHSDIGMAYIGDLHLRSYLIGAGLCEDNATEYISTNYFEENVLKTISNIDWDVKVVTKTPKSLNEADINAADMIVINQTVPNDLKKSGVTVKTFRDENCKFSEEQVMQIFKKIAGVEGQDPVPYIIDFDLYGIGTFVDVRGVNSIQKGDYQNRYGFEYANMEHVMTAGNGDFQGLANNQNQAPNMGTDATAYKLYKLLSCIDPATLYGLYVNCSDGNHGIDEKLNLFGLYPSINHITSSYNRGGKYSAWTDEYFAPNYLSCDQPWDSIVGVKNKMGWFEADTGSYQDKGKNDPGKFNQVIGGGSGRGIVFNSDDGIFYATGIKETITSNIGTIIGSFVTTQKNDYHPYKYLIITSNTSTNNRSVIADMVQVANAQGKGLPYGIEVKCMSQAQYNNINIDANETYDGICSSNSEVLAEFTSDLSKTFGVDYLKLPAEYYTNFKPDFSGENGWGSYLPGMGSIKVEGNKNYINDDAHSGKRSLDFKFKVTGSGSVKIELYVDVDGNCKFSGDEKKVLDSSFSAGNTFEDSIPLTDFYGSEVGKNFVGGFAWRLVLSQSGEAITYDGFSAIRNEKSANIIKILQVYPTDYTQKYGDNWGYESGNPVNCTYSPNPALILPTKTEIDQVSSVLSTLSPTSNAKAVSKYFSGVLTVDTATGLDSNDHSKPTGISKDQKVYFQGSDDNGPKRNHIIIDSSLFYYYLDKLKDYKIEVTRFSVNGFNEEVAKGNILYDTKTGRLGLADGDQEKNLDGSPKYGYTALGLGLPANWKDLTETWTEGAVKKYLVTDSGLIYGYRESSDGSVKYYGAKFNGTDGVKVKGTNEDNEFDILMLGFGSTMDYMSEDGVKLLVKYLENDGPAFIGNGAVTLWKNNTLGNAIAEIIGMIPSTSVQSGYSYVNESVIPLMVTNDTILSHYPYTVEKYMKASACSKQPLRLNISGADAPVVAFTKYNSQDYGHNSWGDAASNYYVYKKGNITFCGYGSTFPKASIDQVGGVMTLAETLMIVNALVAASRFGSGGIASDPYMDCIDPDRSVIGETKMEDDAEVYHFKDAIYTDYDSYDIAAFNSKDAETVFNTPIDSSALKLEGFIDTATNIRWIPYKAKMAIEGTACVEFTTTDNVALPISMYKYNGSSFSPVSKAGANNKYQIQQNGIYYIGVPIDPSLYSVSSSSKLGFRIDKNNNANSVDQFAIKMNLKNGTSDSAKLVELHTIFMIRRVMYHTS